MQPDSEVVLDAKDLASNVDAIALKDGLDPHLNQVSPKENTVGSLTFTVTDSSSEMILKARKPITRTKVPFEKGYSQMDWLKLTRTHPDLAGNTLSTLFSICILMKGTILLCRPQGRVEQEAYINGRS